MTARTLQLTGGFQPGAKNGGGGGPQLQVQAGTCIAVTHPVPNTVRINAEVACIQTPWISNIDAANHTLNYVGHVGIGMASSPAHALNVAGDVNAASFSINGVPFAVAGSINLTNIKNISGETGQPVTITSNTVVTGNVNITGVSPQYQINGVPLTLGLAVQHAGAAVATQPAINLTDTATATFNVANDAGNNRVNISVTAIAAGALADPTTTLGDLIVRGATAPPTRLGIGTNGQVLTADSAETLGMHWVTPTVTTPAGAAGQLQFNGGGTPNVFAASANLHWDTTNSRLGIGTATPGYPLTVAGDVNITGTAPLAVYRVNGVPLAFDATQIDLNPGISTWTTVQNAIAGINTTLVTLGRGMAYVGTYDAAANVATFVASVGIAPGPLPAANATGLHPGDFIIVTTPSTTGPMGALNVGDELLTDGTVWNRIAIGHSLATVTAATVPLSPVVGGWNTVQDAMVALNTLNGVAVLNTGSYANPAWITSLDWSKITGVPAGISGPAGAVGQIQFNAGGTPNVFGASANLFWDSANGRLGVHEAAPAFTVDIDGSLNVTGNIYIDGVVFASPGSAHLHATTIGGLDGAPLHLTGAVQFDSKDRSVSLQQLLDRLEYLELKL